MFSSSLTKSEQVCDDFSRHSPHLQKNDFVRNDSVDSSRLVLEETEPERSGDSRRQSFYGRTIELRKNDSAVHDSVFNHALLGSGSAGLGNSVSPPY